MHFAAKTDICTSKSIAPRVYESALTEAKIRFIGTCILFRPPDLLFRLLLVFFNPLYIIFCFVSLAPLYFFVFVLVVMLLLCSNE